MQPDQAADFVAGILTRNEIPFGTSDDGRLHRVEYGSTAIFINVSRWGDNDAVVSLTAMVPEQLEADAAANVLVRINELNCENFFGKFCLYGDTLKIEHDMLASRLQADELINSLQVVASQADDNDDTLQEKFGGKTWQQVDEESRAEEEALDT